MLGTRTVQGNRQSMFRPRRRGRLSLSGATGAPAFRLKRRGRGRQILRAGLVIVTIAACLSAGAAMAFPPAGAQPADPAAIAAPWRQVSATDERIVLRLDLPNPTWHGQGEAGGEYRAAGFPGRDPMGRGWAPTVGLPTALPPAGTYRVGVTLGDLVTLAQPAGALRARPDLEEYMGSPTRVVDDPGWRPVDELGFVQVRRPSWRRGVRVLPVRVFAVREGAAGTLVTAGAIEIRIDLVGVEGWTPDGPAGGGALGRERAVRVVTNPEQAARWRRARPVARRAPVGDGFGTATSPWLRIAVRERGVYALDADQLRDAGVDPATVDLNQLRLFAGGQGALPADSLWSNLPAWMEPVALHVEDDGDGVWDEETRLCFLGSGPDGWRDDLGLDAPSADDRYFTHPYADHMHYWLCWGGGFSTDPVWMSTLSADPAGLPLRTSATARRHIEENVYYDRRVRQRGLDWPRFFAVSVRASSAGLGASLGAELPGLFPGAAARVSTALWGRTWGLAATDDHYAVVLVNGDTLGTVRWENLDRQIISADGMAVSAENLVSLYVPQRLDAFGGPLSDGVYIDWVDVEHACLLEAVEDSIAFFVSAETAAGAAFRIAGLSRRDGWLLIDGSDWRRPVRLEPEIAAIAEGYAADFRVTPAGEWAHMVCLHRSRAAAPAEIARVDFADGLLRDRRTPVDVLIVAAEELLPAAEALAAHRRTSFPGEGGDFLRTALVDVVTVQQIFDEFSWGRSDPVALRNFFALAYEAYRDDPAMPRLSHLVLCGDAYFDPRGYLRGSRRELVPGMQLFTWDYQLRQIWEPAFYGDDWFGLLDGADDEALDLAIGRLPVNSLSQAWNLVNKIIDYETSAPLGTWRTRMLFAADDVCQGNEPDDLGFTHMTQTERLCEEATPRDAQLAKLFLYEYGAECRYDRKPEATQDLLAELGAGALLFNYVGHGSEVQIADERLLDQSSVPALDNAGRPFLMITASCAVGRFASGEEGLAVQALRLAGRGALAVVSASATAASGYNASLNRYFLEALFPGDGLAGSHGFGPALMAAKWINSTRNDLRYSLMGDPASSFAVPTHAIELRLTDVPGVAAGEDTLLRGGGATLEGEVVDANGQRLTSYTGRAEVLVRDSDIHRTPLPGASDRDYLLPGARIFSGEAEIEEGRFSLSFLVPTALRTGLRGPARAYAYARPTSSPGGILAGDASGALPALFIPETRIPVIDDTLGPAIGLYWEDPSAAVTGGSVIWATLQDVSGIYVAALAPSRSVVLTIEDRDERILVAEDLAATVSFGTDFRQAVLRYAIPEGLPAGEALTLALEASDNVGRRGRATLAFSLGGGADSLGALLGMVYNFPNPMERETRFLFELEREADVEVALYTVSGHKILDLEALGLTPARGREMGIPWDGRDQDGDRVANGLYFYRVVARDFSGRRGERIERLVVLR
ncbi:MAG: hypothetical protein KAY32_10310 [Candidatus Eisenbacteria sp.]|nr:hypothetical protein [Candidatus Eisenbacteria bacterium]